MSEILELTTIVKELTNSHAKLSASYANTTNNLASISSLVEYCVKKIHRLEEKMKESEYSNSHD